LVFSKGCSTSSIGTIQGEQRVRTPTVSALVRGTEFNVAVEDDGTHGFSVIDGAQKQRSAGPQCGTEAATESLSMCPGVSGCRENRMVKSNDVIQWS